MAYRDNVGNTLAENRVGRPVNSRDSSLGVIDDPHDSTANGDSAVSSLARICRNAQYDFISMIQRQETNQA